LILETPWIGFGSLALVLILTRIPRLPGRTDRPCGCDRHGMGGGLRDAGAGGRHVTGHRAAVGSVGLVSCLGLGQQRPDLGL